MHIVREEFLECTCMLGDLEGYLFQELLLEICNLILRQQIKHKEHGAIQGKINAVLLKLHPIHLEKRQQVQLLQINPHAKGPEALPGLLICDELDIGLKLLDCEGIVEVLEHLQQGP